MFLKQLFDQYLVIVDKVAGDVGWRNVFDVNRVVVARAKRGSRSERAGKAVVGGRAGLAGDVWQIKSGNKIGGKGIGLKKGKVKKPYENLFKPHY